MNILRTVVEQIRAEKFDENFLLIVKPFLLQFFITLVSMQVAKIYLIR